MRIQKLKTASVLGLCLLGGLALNAPARADETGLLRVHGGDHLRHIPEMYLGYYVPRFHFDLSLPWRYSHRDHHHRRDHHRHHRHDRGRGHHRRGHHDDGPSAYSRGRQRPYRDRVHY